MSILGSDDQDKIEYFEKRFLEIKLLHKNYEFRTAITGNRIDVLVVPFSTDENITAHVNIDKVDNFLELVDKLFYTIEDTIALREKPDSELFYYMNE